MKKNDTEDKGNPWKFLRSWVGFGAIIVVAVWGFYIAKHGSLKLSSNLQTWADFGDYFTGVAGPLLSFLALYVVAYSIFKTHQESSAQLTALREQNSALAKQVGISALTTAVDLLNRVVLLMEERVHRVETDCKAISVEPLKITGTLFERILGTVGTEGYAIKTLYDFGLFCTKLLQKGVPASGGFAEWELKDEFNGMHDWLVKELNKLDDSKFDRLIEGLGSVMDAIDRMFRARNLFEKLLEQSYSEISTFASLPEREIKVARALSLALIAVKDKLDYKDASIRRKILISSLDLN